MPWSVFRRIGKNDPMKVMKMMLSSFDGHSMIAIGTQAIAGNRPQHLGHRKDHVAREPESPHHESKRHGNDGGDDEADGNAAAAQHHMMKQRSDHGSPA